MRLTNHGQYLEGLLNTFDGRMIGGKLDIDFAFSRS